MRAFDKELIINGEAYRSPEQQVYKNMEDIKTLFQKIQTWYNCSEELEETDNTVLRSYTNVPDSASSGILIDPVGNMFSITGGDDTTLLITFYASIKGPQGPSGAELEIDDSGTSATKVWSSQKVATELASAGKTYYQHNITAHNSTASKQLILQITNHDSTPFTFNTLLTWLYDNNFKYNSLDTYQGHMYLANGKYYDSNNTANNYIGIMYYDETTIKVYAIPQNTGSLSSENQTTSSYPVFNDDVVEL